MSKISKESRQMKLDQKTKTTQTINFKLCTYVSKRLLQKTLPAFFLIMCYFFFYCNNSTSFESVFCMKTVKSRLFKKYLKRKKVARTLLFVSWLAKYEWKKFIENYNSVGAGAHKVRKVVFGPTLTLIFLIFGKCESITYI